MPTLRDHLLGDDRQRVVSDTCRLIDSEMGGKRGVRAVPLKAAYKLVKGFKPGFVPSVVDAMLPEFCDALEPYYQTWAGKGDSRGPLDAELRRQEGAVAEALLGVADRRVDSANMRGAGAIQKAYRKLRGTARGHVASALPGLARTVEPYLKDLDG
ncbi:MAG TPA: hypothetical protein DEA08_29365 [Planctomycetes bacterium]|nr:hypothetical protein [Planctomycetota bacterium]|tara:strand:+ start:97 stop:564 length:468 start_codon:yes stop_codon:yes gene_type:complete